MFAGLYRPTPLQMKRGRSRSDTIFGPRFSRRASNVENATETISVAHNSPAVRESCLQDIYDNRR